MIPTGSLKRCINPTAKNDALLSSTTEYNLKKGSDSIEITIGI